MSDTLRRFHIEQQRFSIQLSTLCFLIIGFEMQCILAMKTLHAKGILTVIR